MSTLHRKPEENPSWKFGGRTPEADRHGELRAGGGHSSFQRSVSR